MYLYKNYLHKKPTRTNIICVTACNRVRPLMFNWFNDIYSLLFNILNDSFWKDYEWKAAFKFTCLREIIF